MQPLVITIDGPAGAGKSTVAQRLAQKLGLHYVDSGAMYRAAAMRVLECGVRPIQASAVLPCLTSAEIQVIPMPFGLRVILDGRDVTASLRSPRVSQAASQVSQLREVRLKLIAMQRHFARGRGVVMEGRDIGTVVFPNAPLKIFLTARPEERARRRWSEERKTGRETTVQEIESELCRRDQLDAEREISPLRAAPDAVMLDTTDLAEEQVVQRILVLARERRLLDAFGGKA